MKDWHSAGIAGFDWEDCKGYFEEEAVEGEVPGSPAKSHSEYSDTDFMTLYYYIFFC
jgi:hypothetical protein